MKKARFTATCAAMAIIAGMPAAPANAQAEPFIGQATPMAFNFCPRNWAAANGQLLAIASNSALFSLLGTTYGGDGRTTFALPDMRSRVPIGDGQGPGLSNYVEGQRAGQETVTLTINELPSHTHAATVHVANINGNTRAATNANFATATGLTYDSAGTNGTADVMNAGTVVNGNTGGNQAHENRMPYVALNWCIALFGIFPSRN